MARGTEPLLGLEWESDEDLRNGDPRIRIRVTDATLDRLVVQGKPLLFEAEVSVAGTDNYGDEYRHDRPVVIEIERVD